MPPALSEPAPSAAVESSAAGPGDVTVLLQRWSQGDQEALPALVERVVPELRKLAQAAFRREPTGHTLQPHRR